MPLLDKQNENVKALRETFTELHQSIRRDADRQAAEAVLELAGKGQAEVA